MRMLAGCIYRLAQRGITGGLRGGAQMPVYRVTVEDHEYTVEIADPNGRPVQAIVDGQLFEVEVEAPADRRAPGDWRAPAAQRAPADRPVPVERIAPTERGLSSGEVGGASAGSAGDGGVTIAAPLPGTIVSIGVSEGDRVEHGQELCILEAMKMNNPIRAARAGVVKKVLVSVGQQVQHGHPLLVVAEA
jgi:glutaconyl-CoA/methylmalonyl-CoA decarboxylase subunit gamma